jgi:hypothetical protein
MHKDHKHIPIWAKLLIFLVVIVVIMFTIGYFFLAISGERIIARYLEASTGKKVAFGNFHITPLSTIFIKNMDVEGIFKCDSIYVAPNILYLLFGNIAITDIKFTKPELIIERKPRTAEDVLKQHGVTVQSQESEPVADKTRSRVKKRERVYFMCENFFVQDGVLKFIDHTAGNDGITITVKNISASITNVFTIPSDKLTKFSIQGNIPWRQNTEEGKVSFKGWLNYFKKDIQASLAIKDIDGVYLSPYYSKWVNLEKMRIEKANLNFTTEISGVSDNITLASLLELTDIIKKKPEAAEGDKNGQAAVLPKEEFNVFEQNKIDFKFNTRTKFDFLEFSFDNIKMSLTGK